MSLFTNEMTRLIKETRARFLIENNVPSYYQINNGLCEEFASLIGIKFSEPSMLTEFWTESLEDDEGLIDWEFLEKWGVSLPPHGLTKDELDDVRFGGHCFLHLEGRWFDAECPEGATSPFELPIFRRPIVRALRLKGIPTADVVTDDVVTPPPCKVPNPTKGHETAELSPSP